LLRADRPEDAEHLALTMAETVTARPDTPRLVSEARSPWLVGTVLAARRTGRGHAAERHAMADGAAVTREHRRL
jgi:hypothetical protein